MGRVVNIKYWVVVIQVPLLGIMDVKAHYGEVLEGTIEHEMLQEECEYDESFIVWKIEGIIKLQ